MSTPTTHPRPLSPFMTYRWQYTNTLSILHRIAGCALSAGLLLLVYWLTAAATGPDAYAEAQQVFAHPLIRIVLGGLSFAFFYHLLNGTRHLVWDAGHGFEKQTARISGWLAFLGAVLLTAIFWAIILNRLDGAVQ